MKISALLIALLASPWAFGDSLAPAYRPEALNIRASAPALTLTALNKLQDPDVVLPAVALMEHSERAIGDRQPARAGIVREFATAVHTTTQFSVQSVGATRTRLRLESVNLAEDDILQVYGRAGDVVVFGRELLGPTGELWTPSVEGDTIALETLGADVTITALAHIAIPVATADACFLDAVCSTFADRDALSRSIAQLTFISGSDVVWCTGGLINAKVPDSLLLTANHCISTQAEASTVDAYWDWTSTFCGSGTTLSPKKSSGATLLATSQATDVTLLRMKTLPAGRWLMGWTTNPLPAGTKLYRIAHPATENGQELYVQTVATTTVDATASTCTGSPRTAFIYSKRSTGGMGPGASGAPVIIDGGYIVGQLLGGCSAFGPPDGCSSLTSIMDGSLAASWPVVGTFINPSSSNCTACIPNNNTACMLGGRFKVTMPTWRDTFSNLSGQGSLVKYADNLPEIHPQFGPVSESVFFSMYTHAPKSIEALVRIIKGQNINDKYWVFLMGFTGAEYTINIQDTQTCRTWQRTIPVGATTVVKDFDAFPFN
ncbi:MAG TPA: trypsin-like peptidase domain-containing protein [Thermoanaerobaculia bacterium]|jgi:hypothetical protein|nr:trypsin-like peptidase domain-containing protein [Thermoanaerobaculia bacterium]